MTHLTRSIIFATVLRGLFHAAAPTDAAVPPTAQAKILHVRAGDTRAATVLGHAVSASPTVARLVSDLDATDLIVTVVTGLLPERITGVTRIVVAVGGVRHVRIILRAGECVRRLAATLGHELRHALEIAEMPEVRDEASLGAAYQRVGVAVVRGGYFETDAAIETGRLVARELARRE